MPHSNTRTINVVSHIAACVVASTVAFHVTADVTVQQTADAWKCLVPNWQGYAFDEDFPGLPDEGGCLIPKGDPVSPTIAIGEVEVTVSSFNRDGSEVCSIRDSATNPQVSDVWIDNSSENTRVELTFVPPIRAFYGFIGSLASGETASLDLYDSSDAPMQTVTSAASNHNGQALGIGFVSDTPVSRIEVRTTENGVSLLGAFTGLASGYQSLGSVNIPEYQGPNGETVRFDFGFAVTPDVPTPTTHIVPGDFPTIASAINAAQCGDEIAISPGSYTGAGNTNLNTNGKALVIRGATGNPADVTINCNFEADTRAFTIDSGESQDTVIADLTIRNGRITNPNFPAGQGAGIFISQASPTIRNVAFRNNSVGQSGGALFINGNAQVINCAFSDNSAREGGAVETSNGSPRFVNCTFNRNSAQFSGGAIHSAAAQFTVINSTMHDNDSGFSGGAVSSASKGSMMMKNSIVWANDYPPIAGGATVTYSDVDTGNPGVYPGSGNIKSDPMFVLANGGNFRLLANSPCIDAANSAAVPTGIVLDLDGQHRFVDDPNTPDTGNGPPPIVDMGAYEFTRCAADIAGGDGQVNVDDLLAVINGWGACASPCPPSCTPDIVPPGGDCNVNVDDLLSVINAWGPCQ